MFSDAVWWIGIVFLRTSGVSNRHRERINNTNKSMENTQNLDSERVPISSTPLFADLFSDLVEKHGEKEDECGGEDFFIHNESRIGCRYADLSMHRKDDGWHYGQLPEAYPTPAECYANHREDEARFYSANVPRQVSLAGGAGGLQESGAKALGLLFCQQALCLSGGTSNRRSSKLPTGQRLTGRACSAFLFYRCARD